jgi:hypothetical protein
MIAQVLSGKGAQIQIIIETQGLVFTPDNLINVLKSHEFQIGQGVISNPLIPNNPQINAQIFSKDSLMIYFVQNQPLNSLIFTILNTVNLKKEQVAGKSSIEMIETIMDNLNLVDETINSITFNFTTRFEASKKPIDLLTRILNRNFIKKFKDIDSIKSVNMLSMRIGDAFPLQKNGFNIVLEPLISNPEKMFFMQFIKRINDRTSLFELTDTFPSLLESIINGVDPNE